MMTTIDFKKTNPGLIIKTIIVLSFGVFVWWLIDHYVVRNTMVASVDPSVLQVILIALGAWLLVLQIAPIITNSIFHKTLYHIHKSFNPIRRLTSWQQHVLYLALYALVVLSGTGCLIAIC